MIVRGRVTLPLLHCSVSGSQTRKETVVVTRLRFNLLTPRPRFGVLSLLRRAALRASLLTVPTIAALFASSASHIDTPAKVAVPSDDPLAVPATVHGPSGSAVLQANFVAQTNVAQIAEVVAKRYRVSSHATLDLVRTAYREGNRNGLDPLLILAVVAIESNFNPIAQSGQGAVGLMQIVPRFHEDKLARHDGSALDPQINIEVGTQVLREYISRAGTEAAGLQLYNGSPDDPAAAYSTKVMSERDRLRQAIKRAVGNRA